MKKLTILAISLAIFSLVVMPALAQTNLNLGTLYLRDSGLGTKDLRTTIMDIIEVALGFLAVLAIILILWGGFRWMTAGGSEDKVGEAKKIIIAAVIGLIVILSALAITNFVLGSLLNATG